MNKKTQKAIDNTISKYQSGGPPGGRYKDGSVWTKPSAESVRGSAKAYVMNEIEAMKRYAKKYGYKVMENVD